jgi:hypothetical protein
VMMPFARRLFRECMRICGPKDGRVIEALRREADMCKRLRDGKKLNRSGQTDFTQTHL